MFDKFQDLRQGQKKAQEYTTEYHLLSARCGLREDDERDVQHYLHGLNKDIRYELMFQTFESVEEAYAYALQAEEKINYQNKRIGAGKGILRPPGSMGGRQPPINQTPPPPRAPTTPATNPNTGKGILGLAYFHARQLGSNGLQ